MATTLDEEYRKTLKEFATGAQVANEAFSLTTIRVVASNIDGDEDIWTLTAEEAEKRARKYRMVSAYAARGAAICDDRAKEARGELAQAMLVVQP